MARPSAHSDLDKSTLNGDEVITIQTQNFPTSGPLFKALGTFIDAARAAGLVSSKSYRGIEFHLPPTKTQLDEALTSAQESWDHIRKMYEACLISGTQPEDYTRHTIANWCRKEDIPLPWETSNRMEDA